MKLPKVTSKIVTMYNSGCRDSHDYEGSAICKSWKQQRADIKFLSERSMKAGCLKLTGKRETGVSSNSIVAIAYGLIKPKDQQLPSDLSDLNACLNTWLKLPKHRKQGKAHKALLKAVIHIDKKYPNSVKWDKVPEK